MTSCPHDHVALKSSPFWSTLPLVGVQHMPADEDGPAAALEMRNCPGCHSTLAVEVAL